VRRLFARLIGAADGERIAIVPSVSYGIAIAARNVSARPGTNVVIADGQFPSNVYTWRRLCQRRGAELRVISRPAGMSWTERLLEAIDRRTVAVALGTIDWIDGTLFDLDAIGTRAREVGATYVLDGIQSIGALPFDVNRVRPDLLVCSSYKWLLGPMGVGVCYLGERMVNGEPLEETWLGREGSENFAALTEYTDRYQAGARRFDAGGRAHFVLLPMLAAALNQLLAWGSERIQAYCTGLVRPVLAELEAFGLMSATPDTHAMHLFSVPLPATASPHDVQNLMTRHRVQVSTRQGKLRVSPNVYNTEADLSALLRILLDVYSEARDRRCIVVE
jgi:selenocysteine lyase/cysteine desulfurase